MCYVACSANRQDFKAPGGAAQLSSHVEVQLSHSDLMTHIIPTSAFYILPIYPSSHLLALPLNPIAMPYTDLPMFTPLLPLLPLLLLLPLPLPLLLPLLKPSLPLPFLLLSLLPLPWMPPSLPVHLLLPSSQLL